MPFMPEQASTAAGKVDALFLFLTAVSVFFGLLIAGLVVYFFIRYRRRSNDETPPHIHGSTLLEVTWSVVPLAIVMVVFFWSAKVFFDVHRIPAGAMEVSVVGKRWMWKLQHLTGQREINELHVPVGRPVKLTLTSEDVIHSFFVPAFRIKQDAIPGRYTSIWFEATKTGRYHLFCAEYCGTQHSGMIGTVVVLEPHEFQAWLAGGAGTQTPVAAGEKLFKDLACVTCHRGDSGARGPSLTGLFGRPVRLADGSSVTADETYLRESIVAPAAKVVAGYQPIMPTFQGMVSEEQLMQLVAYVKSLKGEEKTDQTGAGAQPAAAQSQDARRP
jgi:cytochrome c oxidase subunit 2